MEVTTNKITKSSFNGHQTFPLRYGWIEKICHTINKNDSANISFSSEELAHEKLMSLHGLGSNMAKSARFWLKAANIIQENYKTKSASFTDFGVNVFGPEGEDPFIEKIETIWRIHWRLTLNRKLTPTWFWYFNYFARSNFDRIGLTSDIIAVFGQTESVVKRDIDCFVRCYCTTENKLSNIEDTIVGPLADLGLFSNGLGTTLVASRQNRKGISTPLIASSILRLWNNLGRPSKTISLDTLYDAPFSPGRVFQMERKCLENYLSELSSTTNEKIALDRSSGLSQIVIDDDKTLEALSLEECPPIDLMEDFNA